MLKLFNRKKKDNKGFTLVELVVVIAILAILVGLLAPQYTKYVEKSRKSADATNLDEMVKVVKIFAADPQNDLPADDYWIEITPTNGANLYKGNTKVVKPTEGNATTSEQKLLAELNSAISEFSTVKLKSQKWSDDGKSAVSIWACVTVDGEGGTSVSYAPTKLSTYVDGKPASTLPTGSN